MMARDGRYNPVVVERAVGLEVGKLATVRLLEARGVYLLGELA
jgi:hypothetical protein